MIKIYKCGQFKHFFQCTFFSLQFACVRKVCSNFAKRNSLEEFENGPIFRHNLQFYNILGNIYVFSQYSKQTQGYTVSKLLGSNIINSVPLIETGTTGSNYFAKVLWNFFLCLKILNFLIFLPLNLLSGIFHNST